MEIQGYNMREDLYYEEHHFGVKEDGDILVMGMDGFAQTVAGEIVYVQLPHEGKTLKAGKKFAKLESGKWVGKVFALVNGGSWQVLTRNWRLIQHLSMMTVTVRDGYTRLSLRIRQNWRTSFMGPKRLKNGSCLILRGILRNKQYVQSGLLC